MPEVEPRIIIRMGSHSEKEYLLKTAGLLDGMIVGANLVEATSGATASLLGKKIACPYFIDPMTYAYACDVGWIKSQQRNGQVTFKRSYQSLASRLGSSFLSVIEQDRPLSPRDLSTRRIQIACAETVLNYQLQRLQEEFERDEEYKEYARDMAKPAALLAPYFYISRDNPEWLDVVLQLSEAAVSVRPEQPVHTVICAERSLLSSKDFLGRIKSDVPRTGVSAVWLRFMDFSEIEATETELRAMRDLAETLSAGLEVNNMHGGYFSMALSKYGLACVSHGVGYGERKSLAPIIGAATPTVRYYLPEVHRKFGVPEIERCFRNLDIRMPEDFHERVCDCVVCKGIVSQRVADFRQFGDQRYARDDSKRKSQTPAAAKRCRFHFMLNRIRERDRLRTESLADVCQRFAESIAKWGNQVSIREYTGHLAQWKKVLES